MTKLGYKHAIPKQCQNADFVAEAEARSWLAHPNEYGRQPDEIRLFDTRTLFWPPANESRRLHLFHYRYAGEGVEKSDIWGVIMTGGLSTFSLFREATIEMPAEDVYALHCCWELQWIKDPRAPEEGTVADGRRILNLPTS